MVLQSSDQGPSRGGEARYDRSQPRAAFRTTRLLHQPLDSRQVYTLHSAKELAAELSRIPEEYMRRKTQAVLKEPDLFIIRQQIII